MDALDLQVPEGPAAEFQHRLEAWLGDHPARDALLRSAAELVARLAPGALGDAASTGAVHVEYPDSLNGTVCRASISVEITYPAVEADPEEVDAP